MASNPSRIIAFPQCGSLSFELVHQGRQHQIFRSLGQDTGWIVKRTFGAAPEAAAVAALRHEYQLLQGLDVPGIVRVKDVSEADGNFSVLMEDAGPGNLAEKIRQQPLSVTDFLEVARGLADTVNLMHAAHVVHRNINPANIVWNPRERKATLVDFGSSTTLASLIVDRTHASQLEGELAYISPEQTGRIGRAVDSRTDLYSLGATFYELLIGVPPFVVQDPIELVHAHLAQRPQPPHLLNPRLPSLLSDIVLKLLEKEPEQRYQTAEALALDLQEAQAQWSQTGTLSPFPLARHDVSRWLRIPDKLYGRSSEIKTLEEAFTQATKGKQGLVLVTGAPGIGKSALVNQVEKTVVEHRGFFIFGKFDQLQRGVPYFGLVQAFRMLIQHLLIEPERALRQWRERIQAALGANGRVLIEVIPELERVIGPQPAIPQLGTIEAKHRFMTVFSAFLRVFAQPGRPFVLFLDDLQWIDAASLKLIEQWVLDGQSQYSLLIGAYRSNEVAASHPFALVLEGLKQQQKPSMKFISMPSRSAISLSSSPILSIRTPKAPAPWPKDCGRKQPAIPFF